MGQHQPVGGHWSVTGGEQRCPPSLQSRSGGRRSSATGSTAVHGSQRYSAGSQETGHWQQTACTPGRHLKDSSVTNLGSGTEGTGNAAVDQAYAGRCDLGMLGTSGTGRKSVFLGCPGTAHLASCDWRQCATS